MRNERMEKRKYRKGGRRRKISIIAGKVKNEAEKK
jgi:hypothetical protein